MLIPKSERTADTVNHEINVIVMKKDKSAALFKKELVILTAEYDRAVGKESAQRKLEAMTEVEVEEFKILIEEDS